MADFEQMKKIVPFITSVIAFRQHVCESVLVSTHFGVQIEEAFLQQSTSHADVDLTYELFKSHPPAFPYPIVP